MLNFSSLQIKKTLKNILIGIAFATSIAVLLIVMYYEGMAIKTLGYSNHQILLLAVKFIEIGLGFFFLRLLCKITQK